MPRKSRKIPYKKIIAIYCEGESEKAYFKMLKRKYHAANVHVHSPKLVITSVGLSGMSLLKKAFQKVQRLKNNEQAEEVYVVFDRDSLGPSEIADCRRFAMQHNMSIIFSNVNLEIWILMHFQSVRRPYTPTKLNSILSGPAFFNTNYERFKGKPYDDLLYDKVKTAKMNADALENGYSEPLFLNDPFTNMNHAIQEIFDVTEF
ncbi:hypothetical protein BGL52_11850 [Lacticaseibacillus casei]|nr:hypothetical protein BGL52_11850 [Lacticaseibacillus casei]